MKNIKISIIMPCYNASKYIDRSINSLLNQTIGIKNIELILVNDASTDRTIDKLIKYEKIYPESIIVIDSKENLRQGGARNLALQYASGDYIGFVDADDWVDISMYEKMYEKAIEYDCDLVFCRNVRDEDNNKTFELKSGKEDSYIKVDSKNERCNILASNLFGLNVWDKIYKRSLIFDNNIYFPEKLVYEDIFWSSLIYFYFKSAYILEERLYHYYVNNQSTVLCKNKEYHLDILKVNRLKWNEYESRGLLNKYREVIEFDLINTYYFTCLKILFFRFSEVPYDIFIEIQQNVKKYIPNYQKNKYLDKYTTEIYKILLELIDKNISKDEIEEIACTMRKLAGL